MLVLILSYLLIRILSYQRAVCAAKCLDCWGGAQQPAGTQLARACGMFKFQGYFKQVYKIRMFPVGVGIWIALQVPARLMH